MFIVTGGAGFIGSALVSKLNSLGFRDVLIVDSLGKTEKWKNLVGKEYLDFLHKDIFIEQIRLRQFPSEPVQAVYHLGACSSTTETNADYLMDNNFHYTRDLAQWALESNIRFIYASSAATYGDGRNSFSDSDTVTPKLVPLNMYGYSKHLFDQWALRTGAFQHIAGLKFFNVFGPNEYHKGDMASVVYKAYQQILDTGSVKLFKSYRKDFGHGEQKRDFVYVKDVVDVIWQITHAPTINGIFNLGTGRSRTWNDLAHAVFKALKIPPSIDYIDMPPHLVHKYQYHTEANISKLQNIGMKSVFTPLEDAVNDYVINYLEKGPAFL